MTLPPPRRFALNNIERDADKGSNRGKFKRAGWDDAFLLELIAQIASCDCPGWGPLIR